MTRNSIAWTRRGVLLGGAGALLAACGVETLEKVGVRSDGRINGWFDSRWRRTRVGWTIAYPSGHGPGDELPVLVSLHGRGGDHTRTFDALQLGSFLDEVVHDGTPPFAIASVDGGDHGYWHRRTDGTDAGAMVVEEFLPLLAERGLDTDRLGLFGWSMGGYGSLLLAGKKKVPVRAVAVSSPALFTSAGATPRGAFDDAEDFGANNVYGNPGWLRGLPLRVDCGRQDPFYAATKNLVGRLSPRPAGGFASGAHTMKYWRGVAPSQLKFVGHLLAIG